MVWDGQVLSVEVAALIPAEKAERYLSTHSAGFDSYPVRSVAMYGLAECERSRACPDLLRKGAISEFGRWMNISHDGDRVVTWDKSGNSLPYTVGCPDERMDDLIARAEAGSADANLVLQRGAYGCSIPQIDRMVDIALSVEGVLGAQISGAGLGGCIMALIHKDAYDNLEKALIKGYYDPANLEPSMFSCYPVAGSGAIEI